jgi:selT/selW/selH-like putative selenoprotein
VSLAGEILDKWAPVLEGVELKSGSRGVFDVELDGEKVFSKALLNRFPAEGEIAKLLAPQLGPPPKWRPTK